MLSEIKNLKKTARRIIKAIKNKERIVVYGDADLDGIISVIILREAIRNLGGKTDAIYFPDRESEGYGITEKGLKELKKFAPALFISLDCGISSFKELRIAKKMGFEVIIIDHHEILDKLPEASIIVNPKQKGDKYPFKQLATVGLTFKLVENLLKDKMTDNLRKDFLQLTAMATLADMMPKEQDNELYISEGLSYLESSWRPGIKVLLELVNSSSNLIDKVYKINSYMNIRDTEQKMPAAFNLLTVSDENEARRMAQKLIEKGKEKKEKIREIIEEVRMLIKLKGLDGPIIFEGKANWELVLLGVAASFLVKEYKKPVFLYKKMEKESHGSVRAPEGFNTVEAMKRFAEKLITFGGHPQASGFRLKNKYLEEFKEGLNEYFSR